MRCELGILRLGLCKGPARMSRACLPLGVMGYQLQNILIFIYVPRQSFRLVFSFWHVVGPLPQLPTWQLLILKKGG